MRRRRRHNDDELLAVGRNVKVPHRIPTAKIRSFNGKRSRFPKSQRSVRCECRRRLGGLPPFDDKRAVCHPVTTAVRGHLRSKSDTSRPSAETAEQRFRLCSQSRSSYTRTTGRRVKMRCCVHDYGLPTISKWPLVASSGRPSLRGRSAQRLRSMKTHRERDLVAKPHAQRRSGHWTWAAFPASSSPHFNPSFFLAASRAIDSRIRFFRVSGRLAK